MGPLTTESTEWGVCRTVLARPNHDQDDSEPPAKGQTLPVITAACPLLRS